MRLIKGPFNTGFTVYDIWHWMVPQCCNFQLLTMSNNNIYDAQTYEVVVTLAPLNL
jgi:hypothetical protein